MPKYHLLVGTYTENSESRGVYSLGFDTADGSFSLLGAADAGPNPSFLATRDGLLYAANEVGDTGQMTAWRMDVGTDSFALAPLGEAKAPGSYTCHVALGRGGKLAYAASYGSGSLFGYATTENGSFGAQTAFCQHEGHGPNPDRQEGPHAHSTGFAPDEAFLIAADLGCDELRVYRVEADGGLSPAHTVKTAPGEGPRHFIFHPNGGLMYLLTELGNHVVTYRYSAADGGLAQVASASALPEGFAGENTGADIHLSPDGKFLYASNRGHDSIAVFALDAEGLPTFKGTFGCGGNTPRNFWISPDGTHLVAANQDSDNLAAFALNPATGMPDRQTGEISIPKPVCVIHSTKN